jgi:hypothetical protein
MRLSGGRQLFHRRRRRLSLDAGGEDFLGLDLGPTIDAKPAIHRWFDAVGGREAVKRGMAAPKV